MKAGDHRRGAMCAIADDEVFTDRHRGGAAGRATGAEHLPRYRILLIGAARQC